MTVEAKRQYSGLTSFLGALWALLLVLCQLSAPAMAAPSSKAIDFKGYDHYLEQYDKTLAAVGKKVTKTLPQLRKDLAAIELVGNAGSTVLVLEQVLSKAPEDGELWRKMAQLLATDPAISGTNTYELQRRALAAGIKAYRFSKTPTDEAATLALVARAMTKLQNWRSALETYKASLALVENPEIRNTYEELLEQHGFRITDYEIDSDAAQPRACFQFSEPLASRVSDFTPYFTQEPGPVSAVSIEGRKLCVEGLKHGQRYTIKVRKGLPSGLDEALRKDYEYQFYVRDRVPMAHFVGRNYVLPRTGQTGIPLVSINTRSVTLSIYRVGDRSLTAAVIDSDFLNQLDRYDAESLGRNRGQKVWEGTLETEAPLNEEVTTAFPVDEALKTLEPGLYAMTAKPGEVLSNSHDDNATQWFVVSDLGISTMKGKDGLHVMVRSVATALPLKDVALRLIARNNEVLGEAKTGEDGVASFPPGLTKGEEGLEPVLVVASDESKDYGFLDLTKPAFDFSDRGVAGTTPPGPLDAFVYVERGVYRRGETVHAGALLRDDRANAVADAPLTLVMERPDGREYRRVTLKDAGAGGRTADFQLIDSAPGGRWTLKAYADLKAAPLGQTTFLVEDYVPNRITFDLSATATKVTKESGIPLKVDGRYLFGSPAAGLELEGEVNVMKDSTPFEAWKEYRFGLADERVESVQSSASDLPQTDEKGHAEFTLALPDLPTTTHPLKAFVSVRMREAGGRAVGRSATVAIAPTKPLLAIKPNFDESGIEQGRSAKADVIALDPNGQRVSEKAVTWTVKKITTRYQWSKSGSSWDYQSVTQMNKVADGTIDIAQEAPASLDMPKEWGQYRLEVSADGFAPASITFTVGYYTQADSDTPDTLPVALDKTSVASGETINVKIDARFEGKASVQVVGDRLLSTTMLDVPAGGTSLPITVGKDWGTGAYVVVSHFRPLDAVAKRMPTRSVGLAWFGIDRDQRTLKVEMSPVETMKPRQALKVPLKIAGLAPGETAFVTVAAVDVGILDLTNYQPPEPEEHFYQQRRMSAEFRDLYGQLIDGMQGTRGRIRSGGDGGINDRAQPPNQAPLSLFSGIVPVGADGAVEVAFDIPAFNGAVRLMAVAWTPTRVGHAVKDVAVRDPVVIAGTLPRFLAYGDQSNFHLNVLNADAAPGDYSLVLSVEGPLKAESVSHSVTLGAVGARAGVSVPILATGSGTATLTARLTGPGGVDVDQTFKLGVIPANPNVTRRTIKQLPKGGSVSVSADLLQDMVPGTGAVSLSIAPLADLDVPGLLKELDRYPYGCSEQLVSRAMPLLYLSELGANDIALDEDLGKRLNDTVARLLSRQMSLGAFGLWGADESDDLWLSAFVTDFLLRAREKGIVVPEQALTDAVDYIRNRVGNAPDVEEGEGSDIAYALYTLARAGRAPTGDLKYLSDTKITAFGTPLARAQIGAALGMMGDKPRADEAFASALQALKDSASKGGTGSRNDYGSTLRDAAAIIALVSDAKAGSSVIKETAQIVSKERSKRRYASTQEMTWMVLAARAVAEEAKSLALVVDGQPKTGAFYKVFREADLAKSPKVGNAGAQPLRAVVAATGSPKIAEPAGESGMTVSREYFTLAGERVDPTKVAQNTRLVVVLSASLKKAEPKPETEEAESDEGEEDADPGKTSGTFLMVDRLPAGLEIENPNLIGSGSSGPLPWLKDLTGVDHQEFRDDRFVAAFSEERAKVAYVVRAVAPGRYVHPGATVEDMYRPELNARSASATMTVAGK